MYITGKSGLDLLKRDIHDPDNDKYPLFGFLLTSVHDLHPERYDPRALIFDLHHASGNLAKIYLFHKNVQKTRLLDENFYINNLNLQDWGIASTNESYIMARAFDIDTQELPGIMFFESFNSKIIEYVKLNPNDSGIYQIRSLFDYLNRLSYPKDYIITSPIKKGEWYIVRNCLEKVIDNGNDVKTIYNILSDINSREKIRRMNSTKERIAQINGMDYIKLEEFEDKYELEFSLLDLLDKKTKMTRLTYRRPPLGLIRTWKRHQLIKSCVQKPLQVSIYDVIRIILSMFKVLH
jgi:hypothetical protein